MEKFIKKYGKFAILFLFLALIAVIMELNYQKDIINENQASNIASNYLIRDCLERKELVKFDCSQLKIDRIEYEEIGGIYGWSVTGIITIDSDEYYWDIMLDKNGKSVSKIHRGSILKVD